MNDAKPRSFLRAWGTLAGITALGALVAAVLVGVRLWAEGGAERPVQASYASYLSELAARSASARRFLQAYADLHARPTVASRHFDTVCREVTLLAERDGVDPSQVSEPLAWGCRRAKRPGMLGALP